MNNIPKKIGIIAEDESDVEAVKELIKRITGKSNVGFKHFVGRGCGKIKRKADDWAGQLKKRGCSVLILIHDLDKNKHEDLYEILYKSMQPFAISRTLINIPTEEMEAWFLADENGLKCALNLKKKPKTYHHPEKVKSPKEVLGKEIERASDNSKIYLNTKHNLLIAKQMDIDVVRNKCRSFDSLHQFIINSKI